MGAIKPDFAMRYRAAMARINHAYALGDEVDFELALDELFAGRKALVLSDVQRLSKSMLGALTRFRSQSRFATLAAQDIPDAQQSLDHVLTMTEEAAHTTLDIIERSAPLADATARGAAALSDTLDERSHKEIRHFLAEVRGNAEQVRRNLTDVMLAQGFQDLSGQILRGVRTLVGEVESALGELASIAGVDLQRSALPDYPDGGAQGPAIPNLTRNVVSAQDDVDNLIASLGI